MTALGPRIVLVLSAGAFVAFGALFLTLPVEMARAVALDLGSATARTEIRSVYGGLEVAIGLLLLGSALRGARRDALRDGLRASALLYGGLAAGRAVGLALEGGGERVLWLLLTGEVVAAVASLLALRALADSEPQQRAP